MRNVRHDTGHEYAYVEQAGRMGDGKMLLLEGQAAIVTGGARGVAKGIAAAFLKAGARVLIVDREEALGRATEAEFAQFGEIAFMPVYLLQRDSLPGVVDEAVRRFGRIDTLVNAAQASRQVSVLETTQVDVDLAMGTGFWLTLLLCRRPFLTCWPAGIGHQFRQRRRHGKTADAGILWRSQAIRALAKDKYKILYERRFGTLDTDQLLDKTGAVGGNREGAVGGCGVALMIASR